MTTNLAMFRLLRRHISHLLKAGVVILEGLDLSKVEQGFYDLYCLPLKVANSDGAPARTILVGP